MEHTLIALMWMPPSIFARHSSDIDWCEGNYLHSEYVAEYYNTVSNVVFFIVGPMMMYLLHPYASKRSLAVHLVWLMFIIVGLFSVYFHMTLSFLGQMLDELSILWVIAIAYSVWFPRPYFPSFIKNRCVYQDVHRLAVLSFCLWAVAISCWLSDRFFCGFWKRMNFCYLHSIWHIMICITVVYSNTLFSYFDAMYEIPECNPRVQYWPLKSLSIGLPYLTITKNPVPKKNC
ncbi:alkaline ceramidase 1 isoform 3-T3 [Discoglossus pictus]